MTREKGLWYSISFVSVEAGVKIVVQSVFRTTTLEAQKVASSSGLERGAVSAGNMEGS